MTPISDYNTNPDLNTQINSIAIGEGCLPGNVNNAIRQVMADVRVFYNTSGGGVVVPATESVKGIVEFATAAETTAGTDAARAVHPAGLKAALAAGAAGSAGTAGKLATARTIAVSGLATGTATSFDGSANISIPLTAISQADKLTTARTISLSGGATGTATPFDGSANISIPVTGLDVGRATAGTLPAARGGTGRTDGKSVCLATPRYIGLSGGATGTPTLFDGSGPITIPVTGLDVGKATAGTLPATRGGTGRTDGKSAGLASARTISLSGGATGTATAFDGSTNISIPVTGLDLGKATAGTLPVTRGGTGRADGKCAALASARGVRIAGGDGHASIASGPSVLFDGSASIALPITSINASLIDKGVLPKERGGTGLSTGAAPMPAAEAEAVGEWKVIAASKGKVTLPAGGTWAWLGFGLVSFWGGEDSQISALSGVSAGVSAGGTVLPLGGFSSVNGYALCWRVA